MNHFANCARDPCSCEEISTRRYWWILFIGILILAAELFGSWLSGSLALLSDAVHVFGDTFGIGVAIYAEYRAKKYPERKMKIRIAGAKINATIIAFTIIWIIVEAIGRLDGEHSVMTTPMLVVAVLGTIGNVVQHKTLGHKDHDHGNFNRKAVRLHILSDLIQSLAVIVAGVLIWITGKHVLDPIISLFIACMMTSWVIRLFSKIKNSQTA